ncbi:hypothetical protein R1flu_020910 [Riccia fluitans]|uniref:C2H2-type domain-containing protein n=1 Tax=Riccia fluitans TaxID=41844 RepID=A0ABD1ZNC2_9MARC
MNFEATRIATDSDMAASSGAGTAAPGSPSAIAPLPFSLSPSTNFQLEPVTNNVVEGSTSGSNKRKRRPAGTPDPDAEVVALSPRTLLESDRYICDICSQGFQRDQNLQMHRRRHKVPWKLLRKATTDMRKRVYVCPEPTCLHHDPSHALGDLVGIKKHYRRKHSTDKQWKCEKCSKGYAVQSDYKAHLKTCGTRGHCCDCGRVFSRVESFIEHQDTCIAAKEKSGIHIGLVSDGQQNRRLDIDSPSSRSLSADCLSVDPSRSALSDSAVMPSCSEVEYGEMPVSSSSPSARSHQWVILGDNRELQLLPEDDKSATGHGSSQSSIIMHMLSNPASDRRVSPVFGVRGNPSPDPISVQSRDGRPRRTQGEDRESTPRLQLSIGPYSVTEDVPNFGEKHVQMASMAGHSTHADVYNYDARSITATERAAGVFSRTQQHQRLQRRASDGSITKAFGLEGNPVGVLHSLNESAPARLRGAAEILRSDINVNKEGREGLGESLRLSSSSQLAIGPNTGRGSACMRMESGADEHSGSVASLTFSKCTGSWEQSSKQQSTFLDCTDSWEQSSKQQAGNRFTPTTSAITILRARTCVDEKMATMMPLNPGHQIHSGGTIAQEGTSTGAAAAAQGVELETTSQRESIGRPDFGNAWSELAVARRTKEQARVELEQAESQLAQAELLKQEAREQMKLASAEKTYAEHARENAKRQRELAESELNSAKRAREEAQSEIAKAQMLKERADHFVDIASRCSLAPATGASMSANCPTTDATSTAQIPELQHNSYHHHRQVPFSRDRNFASLPLEAPSFSPTLSSFQVLPSPRYSSSSVIPPTFTGTSSVNLPSISLPPYASYETIRSSVPSLLSMFSSSSSMVTESHDQTLRSPKPEII